MQPHQQYPYPYAPTTGGSGVYIGPTMPGVGPTPAELKTQSLAYSGYGAKPAAKTGEKSKKRLRTAGGQIWEDSTLDEWPEDDYRVFVGDLGNEVNDDTLYRAFEHYSSLQKARVIRDKVTTKSKGYGFVSLTDPMEFLKCLREMNGTYIGHRPCKIKKSDVKRRDLDERKKRDKDYTMSLIRTQSKGTGKKAKKRAARPENANRDELRAEAKKAAAPPLQRWGDKGGGGRGERKY